MNASHEGTKTRMTDSVTIPNGWDLRRLKHVGMVVSGTGFPHEYQGNENEELPFLKVSDMSAAGSEKWVSRAANSVSRETARELGASVVPENSVVYAKIGAALLLNKRRLLSNPSCIDNNMSAFVPRAVVPEWALWWMSTLDFGEYVNPGAIPSFTEGQQKELPFLVPPTETQRLIADYLDLETARIDALVAEKEKMLALLEEKRAALISRAVTRGLDPNTPLKPSGLDWLGDIPAHWGVIQVRFACPSLQTGPFGSQLHAEEYIDNGVPVINPAHLRDNKITPDYGISVDDETAERLSVHKLRKGDVVFGRRGELGRCGVVEMFQVGWLCGTGSLRVRCDQNQIDPKYLALIFNGTNAAKRLTVESVGSTMDNLNTEMLGHFRIPYPPIDEQKAIVSQVEIAHVKTRKLADQLLMSIGLAKERRAALITAAVTGQIPAGELRP